MTAHKFTAQQKQVSQNTSVIMTATPCSMHDAAHTQQILKSKHVHCGSPNHESSHCWGLLEILKGYSFLKYRLSATVHGYFVAIVLRQLMIEYPMVLPMAADWHIGEIGRGKGDLMGGSKGGGPE